MKTRTKVIGSVLIVAVFVFLLVLFWRTIAAYQEWGKTLEEQRDRRHV